MTARATRWLAVLSTLASTVLSTLACGSGVPPPAPLDTAHEACASCRMIVTDPAFASQIVAPLEEPRFFDDLGCLVQYLQGATPVPPGAMVYVADHGTRAWVPASSAVYTRVDGLTAPMGSHVIAHASAASRDADPAAAPGTPLRLADVFPKGLPGPPR